MTTQKDLTRKAAVTQPEQQQKGEEQRHLIAPPVDVLENENEYLLIADVPGASPDEVKIELHNGELTLRAPTSYEHGVDLFSGTRAQYEYARRFRVPNGIDADQVKAELNFGVLRLHLPKGQAAKPRQITVR